MNQNNKPIADQASFLAGGGEMGTLIRSLDWSKTPLGPVESWSPTLQTTVRTMLVNRFPLLLWWGPQYIQLYNDAYRPIPGAKHPKSLGQPASECWPEIWHVIGPLIDTPFHGGPATWMEDIFLEPNRHGFVEETHFTIAYSPVPDDAAPGGIGGVLGTVHEITEKVVGERRMVALRDLGNQHTEVKTAEEACAIAAQTLALHSKDVPFALLYLIDTNGKSAYLAGAAGIPMGETISPVAVDLDATNNSPWPLVEARRTGKMQVVADLGSRFTSVPPGPWSDPPHTAVVLPIRSNKPHELAGFLIAGMSARLRFDDAYRDFLELATAQVATAIANARAYEEERRRAEALAELDRAKTAFFSNVSHEFRTPLTLMLGPVEELLARSHTDLSPAAAAQLEVVRRSGLRLLRLVNTLLDFSRIEAGRVRAIYQPTDLAAYTADLASVFRAAIERAGLRLTVDCPPLTGPVFVDREMWEKIVLNLLSNAFKFTFEGEIAVTLREAGIAAELRVRDTGTGIPAEEMPRLFERFHRVWNAHGRTHEGSGIGLALVQELVKLHGGTVTAESALGRGTTFTVTLPLGSAHLPPDQIGSSPPLSSTATEAIPYVEEALLWLPEEEREGDGPSELPTYHEMLPGPYLPKAYEEDDDRPCVLVADDNADMRKYLIRLLAEHYRVEAVPDGEAALAALVAARERLPDLILSDVMMPRLDGFGLLRELRADPRTHDLPVILLSARAGEESRVDGMEAGADDYLVKPFSARELLAHVSAHLRMARLRREANEALRESHDRFVALFDAAPIGMYLVDAEMRMRYVNPKARHTFGDIENLIGSDFVEVIHVLWPQSYADEMVRQFRHTLETGEPYFVPEQIEERLDRKVTEYYEWQINRITLPCGKHGVVCYFSDISRHVLARRALAASEQALADADRRKDEFLATLAHELRNPLAPLRNGLQIMRLASHDQESVEQARMMMERQLGQMIRLIDDLLDLSRIRWGKIVLCKERVPLAVVAQRAIETSRPVIEQAGHELSIDVPPDQIHVDADVTRLAQVFSNLLNNAAKFTERGGRITLTVQRRGSDVVTRVRDNGVGIPAHMLPRVFDMFTQVDRSLGRLHGGLGIGLSLVKNLVEMHGGSIEAHSEGHDTGSEFVVRLPVVLSLVGPQRGDDGGTSATATNRRRILVVDDNRDSATSLAKMLRIMGNETRIAFDGQESVDMAAAFKPDVILLDIGMPKLNGYDACRRIREQPWGQGVVMVALTGWGQDDDKRRSQEAGFDHHLVKPVDPDALEKLLNGLQAMTV